MINCFSGIFNTFNACYNGIFFPFIGNTFDENWRLNAPTGKSDKEFKIVIKEIERRILQLREKIK